MGTPKGGETAGRLRAARGYAGIKQPAMAAKLGISVETMSRMENGKTTVPSDTPALVAEICGVPGDFMTLGFSPFERQLSETERRILEAEDSIARRVAALEELIRADDLREMLDATRRAKALLDDAAQANQAGNGTQPPADAKPEAKQSRPARKRRSADGGAA